jgi:hypothetical protein
VHRSGFERLAQCIQRCGRELTELVEEERAAMVKRGCTGAGIL